MPARQGSEERNCGLEGGWQTSSVGAQLPGGVWIRQRIRTPLVLGVMALRAGLLAF